MGVVGPGKHLEESVMRLRESARAVSPASTANGGRREGLGVREKALAAGLGLGLGFGENDGGGGDDDDDSILMGSNGGALHLSI